MLLTAIGELRVAHLPLAKTVHDSKKTKGYHSTKATGASG